jgi:trimethylamine:corrinoid methyltransferase-like protein
MLVLTDMMIQRAKYALKEPDFSDETLAVDVIDEVARSKGLYLAHPHTARNFRNSLWIPPSWINREKIDQLFYRKRLDELLTDEANNILSSYKPKELDESITLEIDKYLDSI